MHPPSRMLRVVALGSVSIILVGLLLTGSRGGLFGAISMMLVISALRMPRLVPISILIGVMTIGVAVVVIAMWPGWDGTVVSLVPGDRPEAVVDRLSIWQMAFTVWKGNPFVGVGLGNFREVALARTTLLVPLDPEAFHAHNTYLEILADTGIVELLCYIIFLVSQLRTLLRRWHNLHSARRSHINTFVLAAIGALTAYLVFASVDMLFTQNIHFVLVLLLSFGLMNAWADRALAKGPIL